jgi:hypothetical protein
MGLSWNTFWKYLLGAAACVALGLLGFSGDDRVPLLAFIDLGIHESGHLVTMWAPDMVMFMAGSVAQIAVPLAVAAYFLFRRRDIVGGALCLAWAGTSANQTSVYIADAPKEELPLVGGGIHDWATILGPEGFDSIQSAGAVASAVSTAGAIMVIAGVVLCIAWPFRLPKPDVRTEEELPLPGPRGYPAPPEDLRPSAPRFDP